MTVKLTAAQKITILHADDVFSTIAFQMLVTKNKGKCNFILFSCSS